MVDRDHEICANTWPTSSPNIHYHCTLRMLLNPKSKLRERQQAFLALKYPLSFFCYLKNGQDLQISPYETDCNPEDKFLSTLASSILHRSHLFKMDLVIMIILCFYPEPWHSLKLSVPLAHISATVRNKAKIGA